MKIPGISEAGFAASLLSAGLLLGSAPLAAREFTPDDSKEASGYAAGKGCPGGMEGPNEAANPAAGKPQDKTWEDRASGRPVMVAVPPSESQIMSALCPGEALGARIEAGDLCPICEQLSRLDFSHKECRDMGSTSGPMVIEWECREAGRKYPDEELQPKHPPDAQDQAATEKPQISCESAEQAGAGVEFCTQNRFLKQKAEECLRQIDQAWRKAAPELARLLKGNQARSFTRQNSELKYTEDDYEKTRKKIRALIAATKEQAQKLARYPALMIDNLKHTRPACFRENRDAVQKSLEEVDRKIGEGLVALNAAEELHIAADGRARALVGRYGFIKGPEFERREQDRIASDITGLREDAAKRFRGPQQGELRNEQLPSGVAGFERKKFRNPESAITGRSDAAFSSLPGLAPGLKRELDPSGTFSSRGALAREERSLEPAVKSPGAGSVGAALWSAEGGNDNDPMKLAVVPDRPAHSGAGERAGQSAAGAGGAQGGLVAMEQAPARTETGAARSPASELSWISSQQREQDLFQRVTAGYRRSALFRSSGKVVTGREIAANGNR